MGRKGISAVKALLWNMPLYRIILIQPPKRRREKKEEHEKKDVRFRAPGLPILLDVEVAAPGCHLSLQTIHTQNTSSFVVFLYLFISHVGQGKTMKDANRTVLRDQKKI